MTDMLLARPKLDASFIDVSVGEAHILRENLIKVFDLSVYEVPRHPHMFEYPFPTGFAPLVQLLEDKYKAPVIITNGAKQALAASFFALKQIGKTVLSQRSPSWCLIQPLADLHGLTTFSVNQNSQAHLLVMPNNPDGHCMSSANAKDFSDQCKEAKMPLIHDAAYYTNIYLPFGYQQQQLGDVQIYSVSKSFGLSGLRLGWVVCPNEEFYHHIQQYMETTTVGVSIMPQIFLYDLMRRMNAYPTLTQQFEGQSALDLMEAKKIVKQISSEILEVPNDFENSIGMFGWFKCHKPEAFAAAKINPAWGTPFGMNGYIRMNLAFDQKTMQEIVNRLNATVNATVGAKDV
jgi:aspartate/methionine/tyrosine aminotransferase